MNDDIIVSRDQLEEILKAVSGIGELLKRLPSTAQDAGTVYGIMSNVMVIRSTLSGIPRTPAN